MMYREYAMHVAKVFVFDEKMVKLMFGVKTGVFPSGFLVLGRPRVRENPVFVRARIYEELSSLVSFSRSVRSNGAFGLCICLADLGVEVSSCHELVARFASVGDFT